jgi:hypothetical protein
MTPIGCSRCPLRFATRTAPLRGPPPSPPKRVISNARLQSLLDKSWGQGHCASIFDRVPAGCPEPNFHPAMSSTVRRVWRTVKRWRLESPRTTSRRCFPGSRRRLRESYDYVIASLLAKSAPLNVDLRRDRFSMFNNERDIFHATHRVQSISSLEDRTSDISGRAI